MYGNEAENNHCSLLCVHVRLLCGYHCCLWKLNRNYRAILMHARRQFLSPIQVKNYSLLSQKTSWQGAFNLLWGVRKWIRYNWSLNSNSFWSLVMAASHSLYNVFFFFFWRGARLECDHTFQFLPTNNKGIMSKLFGTGAILWAVPTLLALTYDLLWPWLWQPLWELKKKQ